jgi:hypothetical protein
MNVLFHGNNKKVLNSQRYAENSASVEDSTDSKKRIQKKKTKRKCACGCGEILHQELHGLCKYKPGHKSIMDKKRKLDRQKVKEEKKLLNKIKEQEDWELFDRNNPIVSQIISDEIHDLDEHLTLDNKKVKISIPAIIAYKVRMYWGISMSNAFIKYYVRKHKKEIKG